MILGISYLAWMIIIGICIAAVLVVLIGWYVWYCVFDWGVHYVKHVWKDEESEYCKPITMDPEKKFDSRYTYIDHTWKD